MAKKPNVGVIMGSDSDLRIMNQVVEILTEAKVSHEVKVGSAHRTPEMMQTYARKAKSRGLKVIVAGAGGAAHLPGMVASLTILPVIGVPILVGNLNGVDALLSIAQMPKGIPVATVAVDGGANAGLLAIRILATEDKRLAKWLDQFQKTMKKKVAKANQRLKNKQ